MAHELYTTCTACGAVFEITLEQLGLANGAVRCGVCGETFNARKSLREGVEELEAPGTSVPPGELTPPETHEATLVEDSPREMPIGERVAGRDAEPAFADDDPTEVALDTGGKLVALDLLDESLDETEEIAIDIAPADEEGAELDKLLSDKRDGPNLVSTLLWGMLGALMLVVALTQAAVYWRDQLVQVAWLNGPLLALNERLGGPVDVTYDVSRYRFVDRPRLLVDTLGDATTPQILEVQAELANEASVPQPLPHLRLILEDRWGRPVASRALAPSEYLAQGQPPERFLRPDERINASARVTAQDASPQAYTLDICLPATGGRLDCGDSPTKR
ncbi:MAG: DUF3426 domain-containing protein [Pseudomonadota bacterium]